MNIVFPECLSSVSFRLRLSVSGGRRGEEPEGGLVGPLLGSSTSYTFILKLHTEPTILKETEFSGRRQRGLLGSARLGSCVMNVSPTTRRRRSSKSESESDLLSVAIYLKEMKQMKSPN